MGMHTDTHARTQEGTRLHTQTHGPADQRVSVKPRWFFTQPLSACLPTYEFGSMTLALIKRAVKMESI